MEHSDTSGLRYLFKLLHSELRREPATGSILEDKYNFQLDPNFKTCVIQHGASFLIFQYGFFQISTSLHVKGPWVRRGFHIHP
jgi:hypothetical protein